MKALLRLIHPHGEPPHWLVIPQPESEAEMTERLTWPTSIRFEALDLNIISMAQDTGDWTASKLREKLK